jgi:hypothetical protein
MTVADVIGTLRSEGSDLIIIGGDFNCDKNRQRDNKNANTLKNLCNELNLVYGEDKILTDDIFTCKNCDDIPVSRIDHFLLSVKLAENITNCWVVDNGENMFDHISLFLTITGKWPHRNKHSLNGPLGNQRLTKDKLVLNKKHRWDKCNLDNYFTACFTHLKDIKIPDSCVDLANKTNGLEGINALHRYCALKLAAEETVPTTKNDFFKSRWDMN